METARITERGVIVQIQSALDLRRDLSQRLTRQINALRPIAYDTEAIEYLKEKTSEAVGYALAVEGPVPENRVRAVPVLPRNCMRPDVCEILSSRSRDKAPTLTSPYFLIDVEVGITTEGLHWQEALFAIREGFRTPLGAHEILSLALVSNADGGRRNYPQPIALGSYCPGNEELTVGIPHDASREDSIALQVVGDEEDNAHWGFPSCAARI